MNAGLITMDRTDARRKLREYRRSVHTKADAEYQAAERAYSALSRGTPLVILSHAFALAPLDARGRVRLAIARATEKQVLFTAQNGQWSFNHPGWDVPFQTRRAVARSVSDPRALATTPAGFALVPMVPPDVRKRRNLWHHWILWEIEAWADRRIGATPDRDPLLLRHLGGEAYAVVGQWDLTDVERAIMLGTRSN